MIVPIEKLHHRALALFVGSRVWLRGGWYLLTRVDVSAPFDNETVEVEVGFQPMFSPKSWYNKIKIEWIIAACGNGPKAEKELRCD